MGRYYAENHHIITTDGVKVTDTPIINDASNAYHYTSADGLKSIIENKSIRFSNIQYMNDYSEVLDGLSIMKKFANKNMDENPWEKAGISDSDFLNEFQTFVFCMSLGNDELPLWNYYSKNSKCEGYNLELDYGKLIKAIVNNNIDKLNGCEITIGKVVYDDELKASLLKECVDISIGKALNSLAEALLKHTDKRNDIDKIANYDKNDYSMPNAYQIFKFNNRTGDFDRDLFFDSLYFSKHRAYEFEQELRIVINMTKERLSSMQKEEHIKYRTLNGNLVPYIDLKFDLNCIDGINIAPMLKDDIAEKGLESFLLSQDIAHTEIKNGIKRSKIPARY